MPGRFVDIRSYIYLPLYILFIGFDLNASHLPSDYQDRLLSPEPLLETLIPKNEILRKEIDNLQLNFYSGDSLFLAGQLNEAVPWYEKAVDNARTLNENWALLVCYNRIGFTRYWLNQFEESKFFYAKSVSIINQEKEILDSIAWYEARLLLKITEGMTSRSESILRDNFPGSVVLNQKNILQPARKVKYYFLQTRVAAYNNDFYQMKTILDEEKKILKKNTVTPTIWLFYYQLHLAKYYMFIEDFPLARQYYNELLKLVENDPAYAAYSYFIDFGIFDLNVREHNYVKADEYSGRLLAYLQGKQEISCYSDYLLIGYNYQQLGKNNLALINYKKAENILIRNNLIDDRLVLVYWYIAYYYDIASHNPGKQEYYLRTAKKLLDEYPTHASIPIFLMPWLNCM
jgi:tetratricopeptide (TPR) repeat protein